MIYNMDGRIYCDKCSRRIVLDAFSEGLCGVCGHHIISSSMPCDILCFACAKKYNRCSHCGKELNENEENN